MNKQLKQKSDRKNSCASTEVQSSGERDEEVIALVKKPRVKKDKKKFKTEFCKNFSQNGYCPYGKKCRFAHGATELMQTSVTECFRTKMCHGYMENGFCPYGMRCQFAHKDCHWSTKVSLMGVNSIMNIGSFQGEERHGKFIKLLLTNN